MKKIKIPLYTYGNLQKKYRALKIYIRIKLFQTDKLCFLFSILRQTNLTQKEEEYNKSNRDQ